MGAKVVGGHKIAQAASIDARLKVAIKAVKRVVVHTHITIGLQPSHVPAAAKAAACTAGTGC